MAEKEKLLCSGKIFLRTNTHIITEVNKKQVEIL